MRRRFESSRGRQRFLAVIAGGASPDSPTRGAAGARASWPPGSRSSRPLNSALLCNWAELTLGLPTLLGALAVPFVWCALAASAVVVRCTLISARGTLALRTALLLAVSLQTSLFVWD